MCKKVIFTLAYLTTGFLMLANAVKRIRRWVGNTTRFHALVQPNIITKTYHLYAAHYNANQDVEYYVKLGSRTLTVVDAFRFSNPMLALKKYLEFAVEYGRGDTSIQTFERNITTVFFTPAITSGWRPAIRIEDTPYDYGEGIPLRSYRKSLPSVEILDEMKAKFYALDKQTIMHSEVNFKTFL
jgi:hypothetical protein